MVELLIFSFNHTHKVPSFLLQMYHVLTYLGQGGVIKVFLKIREPRESTVTQDFAVANNSGRQDLSNNTKII